MPKIPEGVLTDEQIAKISGGDCDAADYQSIFDGLKQNYETLVDFTSYVMERVIGQ
jgi:hypothetical protein